MIDFEKQQVAEVNWKKGVHVSGKRTMIIEDLNSKYLQNIIHKYKDMGYDVSHLVAEQERRIKLELFI